MKRRRVTVYVGSGSPEGVVDGVVHDLYFRKDGSGSTSRYVKESGGAGPTGWVANGDSAVAHSHTLADITDEGALASLNTVGTSQIDNDAVTYAKMQNVSAASKLLGRGDSGSGDVEEITLGTNLSMSGTTLNASGGGLTPPANPGDNLKVAIASAGNLSYSKLDWEDNVGTSTANSLAAYNGSGVPTVAKLEWASHVATDLGRADFVPHYNGSGVPELEALPVRSLAFTPVAPGDVGKYLKATAANTVVWDAPTASVAISTTSIAFTDGDTARRVTITDAAVSATSKVLCSVRRPDTTNDSADRGYLYIPNVVKCASGSFDVLIACLDIGGMDPTLNPPNETIVLSYQVA